MEQKNMIKRSEYNNLDSAYATVLFIILQSLFLVLYRALPESFRAIPIVFIFASFGIELVFALTGLTVAGTRNVDFAKASKLDKKINIPVVLMCFLIAFLSIYGFSSFSNYFLMLLKSVGYTESLSNIEITTFPMYLLYLGLIGLAPAVFEEICFRGTICAGLKKQNKHLAVWLSAIIFMLMHGGPEQTIHQFILGVIFGYIFIYTENLWITILIHFFNNAIAVTAMYASYLINGPETASEEIVQLPLASWIMNIMFSLIMAVGAAVLIYFLVKAIKNQLTKISNNKTNEIDGQAENEDVELATANGNTKVKESNGAISIILFIVGISYLVLEWIAALMAGFGM